MTEPVAHTAENDAHVAALRDAGCACRRPLLGFRPGVGPRCRLCNTVAKRPDLTYVIPPGVTGAE